MSHIQDPRLYPPIYRKLRTTERTLSGESGYGRHKKKHKSSTLMYAPTPMTKVDGVPSGAQVSLVEIPDVECEINFVVVEYRGKRYNIVQDDLRFDYD